MSEVWSFLSQPPRRNALKRVDQRGDRHLGRVFDQQVDMICFAVEVGKRRFKVGTDASKHGLQPLQRISVKDLSLIHI